MPEDEIVVERVAYQQEELLKKENQALKVNFSKKLIIVSRGE